MTATVESKLLFDYRSIDLDQVVLSREDVGRINPQCGDMRQLDYLAWADRENKWGLGIKDVRDDEFWVPLHIPGRPLMPGVLMIEAAAQLASAFRYHLHAHDHFLGFTRVEDTVFRGQVLPGERLVMLVQEQRSNPRRFKSRVQGLVNDRLVFETLVSGMAL